MSMFHEPNNIALRMIQRAAKVYKHLYGDYPDLVGLDIFAHWKEWQETNYLDTYHFCDADPITPKTTEWVLDWNSLPMLTYNHVAIKVEPAVFGNAAMGKYGVGLRCTDPSRGHDEVWCKRGEQAVMMSLFFAGQGWHAIVWDAVEESKQ